MVRHGVDRVHLVVGVEVRVEAVHHHDQLVGRRAPARRVDDEHTVETLVDVPLQRNRVTVVEVQAERLGVELVDKPITRLHLLVRQRPVHLRRVPAVKVDGVRMRAHVDERHADAITLRRAKRGARHLTVVGPRRKEHAGRDLDLAIDREDLVLAKQRAVGPLRLAVEPRAFLRREM